MVTSRRAHGFAGPAAQNHAHIDPKTLYIGVYRDDPLDTMFFSFVGPRVSFMPPYINQTLSKDAELIGLRCVPPSWSEGMQLHIKGVAQESGQELALTPLGYIRLIFRLRTYSNTKIAYTAHYHPKYRLDDSITIRGLGYKTEIILLESLVGQVTHVSTTALPSDDRINQLQRAGLPLKSETPIYQWLEGLRRGLRRSLREQRHENSLRQALHEKGGTFNHQPALLLPR